MTLSREDKKILLDTARAAITAAAEGRRFVPDPPSGSRLNEPRGAFVSLHKGGDLRGCIGTFSSENALFETVSEMAVSAAMRDPRFRPVAPSEIDDIGIEISALTPLREVESIKEIEVGRHGIYIMKGAFSGVLLPQVAAEHGWDRETFLDETCMKACLPPGAWRDGARVLVFEAEVFNEEELAI